MSEKFNRTDPIAGGLLTLLWLFVVFAINPLGNFPLNDDWAYGKAVQSILAGDFRLTDWAPASQVAQSLWGALFCLPAGFSFDALRFSTLVLGWIGVIATYALARDMYASWPVALIAALVVLFNPAYLNLAYTFMTDVPFYTFCVLAIVFLLRGLRRDTNGEMALGTLFACAATLTRQFALVLPFAFCLAYVTHYGLRPRRCIKALVPLAVVLLCLGFYQGWLSASGRLPQMYSEQAGELVRGYFRADSLAHVARSLAQAALYSGLFLFPWLLIPAWASWRELPLRQRLLYGGGSSLIALALFAVVAAGRPLLPDGLIPYIFGGVLFDFGIGFPILKDTFTLWLPHMPKGPVLFWVGVTVVGIFGAALIAYFSLLAIERRPRAWTAVFALTGSLAYFLLIATRTASYDRYFLFFLPLLIVLALAQPATVSLKQDGILLALCLVLSTAYGVFSTAAVHDYLAWNRVRWQALRAGMAAGRLTPANTDGGFEFNGWYNYDPRYKATPGKSWWWVDRDDYTVAFGPIAGYALYERYPFERWLPVGASQVLILRRTTP
ncbi:glycosyltransferase family 39 protein [Gloeobacter kilaueensis]|uniref:4-amino-4-deoxy-L-arabinose transferase-related glycosyltransferase of PMT family n=1 Tax=Gloeobacter kilaueensis (strain ATCC BAA-2537 / CCAP 1431/1 / ULC 316 / JS1) TaxID=1183438 RepID=U5QP38_GLOK1|nr:glycosyltransferase family 39 protein [Gloeobacter kilaueensis]AGY59324.1 4-amino-4-deoxy-L-arabinose transferase-related glycosyltransferase of PMT family [Gloeobacter kilaueensis JS1]